MANTATGTVRFHPPSAQQPRAAGAAPPVGQAGRVQCAAATKPLPGVQPQAGAQPGAAWQHEAAAAQPGPNLAAPGSNGCLSELGQFTKSVAKLAATLLLAPLVGAVKGVVAGCYILGESGGDGILLAPLVLLASPFVGAIWETGSVVDRFVSEVTKPDQTFSGAVDKAWDSLLDMNQSPRPAAGNA